MLGEPVLPSALIFSGHVALTVPALRQGDHRILGESPPTRLRGWQEVRSNSMKSSRSVSLPLLIACPVYIALWPHFCSPSCARLNWRTSSPRGRSPRTSALRPLALCQTSRVHEHQGACNDAAEITR